VQFEWRSLWQGGRCSSSGGRCGTAAGAVRVAVAVARRPVQFQWRSLWQGGRCSSNGGRCGTAAGAVPVAVAVARRPVQFQWRSLWHGGRCSSSGGRCGKAADAVRMGGRCGKAAGAVRRAVAVARQPVQFEGRSLWQGSQCSSKGGRCGKAASAVRRRSEAYSRMAMICGSRSRAWTERSWRSSASTLGMAWLCSAVCSPASPRESTSRTMAAVPSSMPARTCGWEGWTVRV
jgi:hypothetical protein